MSFQQAFSHYSQDADYGSEACHLCMLNALWKLAAGLSFEEDCSKSSSFFCDACVISSKEEGLHFEHTCSAQSSHTSPCRFCLLFPSTHAFYYNQLCMAAMRPAETGMQGLGAPVLIAAPFPTTSDHNSRHIELGPDNKLYVSFGSPANLDYCGTYGNINACSIVRMNLDGSQVENYAVGQSFAREHCTGPFLLIT